MIYSWAEQIQNKSVKSRNTYEHKDWEIQGERTNTWNPINCDRLNPAERINYLRLPINLRLLKQRVPALVSSPVAWYLHPWDFSRSPHSLLLTSTLACCNTTTPPLCHTGTECVPHCYSVSATEQGSTLAVACVAAVCDSVPHKAVCHTTTQGSVRQCATQGRGQCVVESREATQGALNPHLGHTFPSS